MSPLLRLWFHYVLFVRLVYAGLVNVTVDIDDPRIVYSAGWSKGGCGIETCTPEESLSFRFTGVALYYIGGPTSSTNKPLANITIDRNTTQLDPSPPSSTQDTCNTISFSDDALTFTQHGVNITHTGTTSSPADTTSCISFNKFIYTTFDNATRQNPPPAATSTSAPPPQQTRARVGSDLSMILGLSIGAVLLALLIAALVAYIRRSRQAKAHSTHPPMPMLDRSVQWALGRKHKKRDSTMIGKAGPAADLGFVPPREHERNWQELR